jgi:hypothetical protein
MKVYVLLQGWEYEGAMVVGVYASKVGAEQAMQSLPELSSTFQYYEIEEFDLVEE